MPRTDKEIAAFMEYYNGIDRKWALEHLARTEGKTPAEIREICEKIKSGKEVKNVQHKFSDEMKADVVEMHENGIPPGDIADKHHITKQQVMGIISGMKAKSKKAQPEAYPNQIYDEHELEFEKKIEELEVRCETYKPKRVPASEDFAVGEKPKTTESVWFGVLEEMKQFAVGCFGAGVKFTDALVGSKGSHLGFEIADGRNMYIDIGELPA